MLGDFFARKTDELTSKDGSMEFGNFHGIFVDFLVGINRQTGDFMGYWRLKPRLIAGL